MKEEYIRRVGRLLALPGKQKREVLRDLEEIFASGAEHGETEQGVIQRLGTPEEYIAGVELSLGKPRPGGKLAGLVLSCVACVVCFGLFWAAQRLWVPQDAIGALPKAAPASRWRARWTSPLCCLSWVWRPWRWQCFSCGSCSAEGGSDR